VWRAPLPRLPESGGGGFPSLVTQGGAAVPPSVAREEATLLPFSAHPATHFTLFTLHAFLHAIQSTKRQTNKHESFLIHQHRERILCHCLEHILTKKDFHELSLASHTSSLDGLGISCLCWEILLNFLGGSQRNQFAGNTFADKS
jgi:hypothetical protein